MAGRRYLNGKSDGELAVRTTTTLPQACIDYVEKYGRGESFSARLRWIIWEHCKWSGLTSADETNEMAAIVGTTVIVEDRIDS